MTTYVALLRGINVGGRNRLAMADLRALLDAAGYGPVRTYVQSGNAVLRSDAPAEEVEADVAARIAGSLGVAPAVVVRSAAQLEAVVDGNPFPHEAAADPTSVHAAFTSAPLDPAVLGYDPALHAPDVLAVGEGVLYAHFPEGSGRSRLAELLARPRRDMTITVRNWRTVLALRDLLRAG